MSKIKEIIISFCAFLLISSVFTTFSYAVEGRLSISNIAVTRGMGIGNSNCAIIHKIGGVEGDGDDTPWTNLPNNPYDRWIKVYTDPYGIELYRDVRSDSNLSSVNIKLSLVAQRANPDFFHTENKLSLAFASGYTFGDLPITIKQYNPLDPNKIYPIYDVRKLIQLNAGEIYLPVLDGEYFDGEIYAYFHLNFNFSVADYNRDGKVNLVDMAHLCSCWETQEHDFSDNWADNADLDGSGVVDVNDLSLFIDEWLYQTKHKVEVSSSENGAVVNPGEGVFYFEYNDKINLEAVPDPNYIFGNWEDIAFGKDLPGDSYNSSLDLIVDNYYAIRANFLPWHQHSLIVSSSSGGSVTQPGEDTYYYTHGEVIPIEAVSEPNYAFSHWSGTAVDAGFIQETESSNTMVRLNDDFTLQANFLPARTLSISSTLGGMVAQPGEGSYIYPEGRAVAVAAISETGYLFSNWSGTAVSAGYVKDVNAFQTTVNVYTDCELRANFLPAKLLSVSSSEGGDVAFPGNGQFWYLSGAIVPIQAKAEQHYVFTRWNGTAVEQGMVVDPLVPSTTVTMNDSYTLIAEFCYQDIPLGFWGFNEGEGNTVFDQSGNGHDGIINGAAWVTGFSSYALGFDGTDDYVDTGFGNGITFEGITMSAWVYTEDTDDASGIICSRNGSNYGALNLGLGNQTPCFTLQGKGSAQSSVGTIAKNQWVMLTGTYNGAKFKIYVDGQLKGTGFLTSGTSEWTSGADFDIARDNTSTSQTDRWFNGKIDEVRIYNFALSAIEVEDLYHLGVSKILSISSIIGGNVILPSEGNFEYPAGTIVSIEAQAEPNYIFYRWTGTAVDGGMVADPLSSSTTVTVNNSYTLIAEFILKDFLSLLAYWDFDEDAGTIVHDQSSNGHDGTVYGATWTDGILGNALDFNGSSDYVDTGFGNGITFEGITMSAWVYTEDADDASGIICSRNGTNYGALNLGYGTQTPSFNIQGKGYAQSSDGTIAKNQWVMLTGTYDGSTFKIYVNGVLKGTGSGSGSWTPGANFYIGWDSSSTSQSFRYFDGKIDEVRIYDRALSETEIQALYQNP